MAPELSLLSSLPEVKLKAVIQANAVAVALVATFCMVANAKVSELFDFATPLYSMFIGFGLALTSAFLFRLAVKQPVSSRLAALVATTNISVSILITCLWAFDVGDVPFSGVVVLVGISVILAVFGLSQILLLSRSSHTYQQTDVIAV